MCLAFAQLEKGYKTLCNIAFRGAAALPGMPLEQVSLSEGQGKGTEVCNGAALGGRRWADLAQEEG